MAPFSKLCYSQSLDHYVIFSIPSVNNFFLKKTFQNVFTREWNKRFRLSFGTLDFQVETNVKETWKIFVFEKENFFVYKVYFCRIVSVLLFPQLDCQNIPVCIINVTVFRLITKLYQHTSEDEGVGRKM